MKRHFKLALLIALATGASALAVAWFLPHEPRYQGRSLSVWLRDFEGGKLETRARAADAVRHMGTNAVPFLVNLLKTPNPALKRESPLVKWNRKLVELLSRQPVIKIPSSSSRQSNPRYQGFAGLDALGPAAKDALPALEGLLHENPPDPQALYVVARIGEAALPLLTRSLTNEERLIRLQARLCLDMHESRSEVLFPQKGSEFSDFGRRSCALNVKVMAAVLEEYKRQHPEPALPGNFDDAPPPSLPPEYEPPQTVPLAPR